MEQQNKKVLWQKDHTCQLPLRQPKELTLKQNMTINGKQLLQNDLNKPLSSKMLEEIVATSSLNFNAPEFIPKPKLVQPTPPSSSSGIQNRLKVYKSDIDERNDEVIEKVTRLNISEPENDLKRIKQIINTLTKDPGQFDNLLQIFLDTVEIYLEDIVILPDIVQILIDEAIKNPNFSYSGAKLCWYIEQNSPSFRAQLHLRCKKNIEEGVHLQNILLFIAELYVQLPHVNIYGSLLIESFQRLLANRDNDSIKSICQALKLTGYSLENTNKNELNDIINKLESMKSAFDVNIQGLINRILLLRNINWGMEESEEIRPENRNEVIYDNLESNEVYDEDESEYYEDNFVHNSYLSDNTELTQEEEQFLANNMISNEEFYSHADSDDPEMDDEIQEAYEEFLKSF